MEYQSRWKIEICMCGRQRVLETCGVLLLNRTICLICIQPTEVMTGTIIAELLDSRFDLLLFVAF